jgi:ABC-2 type transport system ATP-binding protein
MTTSVLGNPVAILHTHGLTKMFGNVVIVDHIDLEVRRGDVFGFLGPNGSGKTTTIRLLLGLLRPTSGTITIFDMPTTTHLQAILPRIGALIETPVFYDHLSGFENLRVLAARSGMKSGKETSDRIDDVLRLLDLHERAAHAYHTYSLGMKQRLGVGAALLNDPELLLLDEPTNGLDPAGMQSMRQLLLRLAASGKTIFLSSHLLSEIELLCNRAAILHRGGLIRQGTIQGFLQAERIVVRMPTPHETEKAFSILQDLQRTDHAWLRQITQGKDSRGQRVIFVEAPLDRSPEIAGHLAHRRLFTAELYHYQMSLEEFFLDLTSQDRQSKP